MTGAISLCKHVKELQDMGADEAMIAAAKGLARNAISRAGMLDNAAEESSSNN
jgi:hypothetical protein